MEMSELNARYINPFTDYGFKRLFGEEPNKALLLDFLNELLKEKEGEIKEISYMSPEKLPFSKDDRKAIFDLYCTNERGEKFIVELQKTKQKYFKDRTVYYSTFPIQERAIKGKEWDFKLKNVYTVAILDFVFDEDKDQPDKWRYDVKLSDIETNKVFYDKLTFVYLEMPKFNKKEHELETKFDKWLFILKNLNELDKIPAKLKESIFLKLFKVAEIAQLSRREFREYEASLKVYRDIKNSIDTARDEGREQGREEGREEGRKEEREKANLEKLQIAKGMLRKEIDVSTIIELTSLTREEIENLREK
jgi:predicted transposase/invertase (TIGR01784 family)